MAISVPSTMSVWPTMTFPISARSFSQVSRNVWICCSVLISKRRSSYKNGDRIGRRKTGLRDDSTSGLLLQIIEIVFDRALIRAGNLFLTERALGLALGSGDRLLISDRALAFDADAFQRNAGHLATGADLALDFGRRQRRVERTVTPIRQTTRVHVGTLQTGVVPKPGVLRGSDRAVIIRPRADAATGPSAFADAGR